MNKEKFLAKGVARKYENGEVLFEVASLHEHYEGINYHLVDVNEDGFIRANDVLNGDIREIEVKTEEIPLEVLEETPYDESEEGTVGITSTLSPEEADALIKEANAEIAVEEIEVVAEEVTGENVIEGELNTEEQTN